MSAPKVSRRIAVEVRVSSIDEAMAFVVEQLATLGLPEPTVSITPMITEGVSFRRVHFIAVVKGTEPTPPTPRCEAWIDLGDGRRAVCYLDAHPSDVDHRCPSDHDLSMDWVWSDDQPTPKLTPPGSSFNETYYRVAVTLDDHFLGQPPGCGMSAVRTTIEQSGSRLTLAELRRFVAETKELPEGSVVSARTSSDQRDGDYYRLVVGRRGRGAMSDDLTSFDPSNWHERPPVEDVPPTFAVGPAPESVFDAEEGDFPGGFKQYALARVLADMRQSAPSAPPSGSEPTCDRHQGPDPRRRPGSRWGSTS
mgnify:CR=1 FL=1